MSKLDLTGLTFRLAEYAEREAIIAFINEHFDWRLPLVNRREFFDYYYCGDRLQFAVAEAAAERQRAQQQLAEQAEGSPCSPL